MVDEAYVDFSAEPTVAPLVLKHPRLVVLHTLSKAFGLAGARVGTAIGSEALVQCRGRVEIDTFPTTLPRRASRRPSRPARFRAGRPRYYTFQQLEKVLDEDPLGAPEDYAEAAEKARAEQAAKEEAEAKAEGEERKAPGGETPAE